MRDCYPHLLYVLFRRAEAEISCRLFQLGSSRGVREHVPVSGPPGIPRFSHAVTDLLARAGLRFGQQYESQNFLVLVDSFGMDIADVGRRFVAALNGMLTRRGSSSG